MTSTTTPLPEDNDEIINEQTIELTTEGKWSYEPSSSNPNFEVFSAESLWDLVSTITAHQWLCPILMHALTQRFLLF
jgi:hypothetical protein